MPTNRGFNCWYTLPPPKRTTRPLTAQPTRKEPPSTAATDSVPATEEQDGMQWEADEPKAEAREQHDGGDTDETEPDARGVRREEGQLGQAVPFGAPAPASRYVHLGDLERSSDRNTWWAPISPASGVRGDPAEVVLRPRGGESTPTGQCDHERRHQQRKKIRRTLSAASSAILRLVAT